jgi:glyoxylase-like metal-dependent hydrolase (beta-lactamase superfamily II)
VGGGLANTGFIVGDTGVIIIDAQMFPATAKKVLHEISAITPKPLTTIILTHSDPDHVNALPAYPLGLDIIAHENTSLDMQAALDDPELTTIPTPDGLKHYFPTKTVDSRDSLVVDGIQLELIHVSPAHTNGDLVVYLPVQKVVFAGDLITPDFSLYPGIHLNKHGSSLGWIKSVEAILELKADTYISGHGEPQTRTELQSRLKTAKLRRQEIKRLFDLNKNLDEIKAALNDPEPSGMAKIFPTFTDTTYQELSQQ